MRIVHIGNVVLKMPYKHIGCVNKHIGTVVLKMPYKHIGNIDKS